MRRRHRGALEEFISKRIRARRPRVVFELIEIERLLQDARGYAPRR
jgi:hypothetical protein